jgi:hypothetical protein
LSDGLHILEGNGQRVGALTAQDLFESARFSSLWQRFAYGQEQDTCSPNPRSDDEEDVFDF